MQYKVLEATSPVIKRLREYAKDKKIKRKNSDPTNDITVHP